MSDCTQPGSFPVQCDKHTTGFLKGWRPVALAFFAFAVTGVQAAPVDVYRGTLGGADVVMELGQPKAGGEREGRYFYVRNGVDIPLKGTLGALAEALPINDEWRRAQSDWPVFSDAKQRSMQWRLQPQGDFLLGEWVDGFKGKKLPLSLKRIAKYDPEKIAPQGVEAVTKTIVQGYGSSVSKGVALTTQSAPYDYLKMIEQKLEQGREVVVNPALAWRPVRDARTRFWYPRLTRHPDAKILSQTNALLELRHWEMNLEALGCAGSIYLSSGPEAGSLGNYNHEEVKVSYLSSALMSVVESGSNGCGGAHPNNHFDPFVLDLLRGGYMDFTRLFKGAKYGEYRLELSPQMTGFIQKNLVSQSEPHDDRECNDFLPEYMALMLNKPDKMSFVISGIGHAMGACLGSGVDISFKKLQPYLKPDAERYFQP